MKTVPTEANKCSRCNQGHLQLHYIYDLLEATCPPCYMEQYMKLQNLKKFRSKLEPEIVRVVPGLYLSNEDAALDASILKENDIRYICACGHFLSTPFQGIEYKRFLIGDYEQQNIRQYFEEFISWVDDKLYNSNPKNPEQGEKKGGNVLVHCSAGVSRSASFAIAYLIGRKGMSFDEAYNTVKQARKEIDPNAGFISQLRNYWEEKMQHSQG